MKYLKAVSFAALVGAAYLATISPVLAGREGGVGNGGGAWICQNSDRSGSTRWIKLVDLYEARTEFGWEIPGSENLSYLEILDRVLVKRIFPLGEGLYHSLNEELETVKGSLVLLDADLEIINDALFRIRPSKKECLGGTISYVQLANYTNYGKILIQKGVFEDPKLGETAKAGLLMHEAVYSYLRKRMGEKDSVRARKIVGLLFSNLAQAKLEAEIEKLLGHSFHGIGMEFTRIHSGSFMMGSPENEPDRWDNEKLHEVRFTLGFEMQTTAVTQKQYFDVMGVNPSEHKNRENCADTFIVIQGTSLCPNHPVEKVSYDDVQDFLDRLNARHQGEVLYRLPTEAEWEYADRAGVSAAYPFGSDASLLPVFAWYENNSGGQTHDVAQLKSNAWGLYDMHGNVSQWVQYEPDPKIGRPIVRGGSFLESAKRLRSAQRFGQSKDDRYSTIGFRLVREVLQ